MGYEVLQETPLRVEKMSNLDGIIWAVAPEYENASLFWERWKNLTISMPVPESGWTDLASLCA